MPAETISTIASFSIWVWAGLAAIILIVPSIRIIGPTEVGLLVKRFSFKKLSSDNVIAFNGEAGYQARLLMPGWRWAFWIVYTVEKHPWVQVAAGEIGIVIAQVGMPLPIGAKSAVYKNEFGNFTDLEKFITGKGQKGVQRPVLPPGTLAPIHPVAFLVVTKRKVYGLPVSPELRAIKAKSGALAPESFGLRPNQLELLRIEPLSSERGGIIDTVGIITTYEGDPLPSGDIASRLGGFADMAASGKEDVVMIDELLGSKNNLHNNYQDFQAFLDNGGHIGLQHDPILYGAYALNPFLTSVEIVPMLVVRQGEVAVVKAYVGLATQDTSGAEFKFGSLVRPGRRGIWQEPLRTGKYPINPRCYQAEIVPTAILTLNWSDTVSKAHNLDSGLQQIVAKSREGFVFKIELQVQIHVPDTRASRVISMVGTMSNLVNEVLHAAVGNHFRDKLQSMPAVRFIETRQIVQEEAFQHISQQIQEYHVETKGVYIQDVVLPPELVVVLTQREIANQEIQTFQKQKSAQDQRVEMEQAKGTADMQAELAKSKVTVDIKSNNATARKAEAEGEATYIRETGAAKGAEVEAVGMARAKAFQAQVEALGQGPTMLVNAITALAEKNIRFVPEILVAGGSGALGSLEGLAAQWMGKLKGGGNPIASPVDKPADSSAPATEKSTPAMMTPGKPTPEEEGKK